MKTLIDNIQAILLLIFTLAFLFGACYILWKWYRYIELPKIVTRLADMIKWILRQPEQSYAVVAQGDSFGFGSLALSGASLTNHGGRDAVIDRSSPNHMRPTAGGRIRNRLIIWFENAFPGHKWLGFAFNGTKATVRLAPIKIRRLKLVKSGLKNLPLENRVEDKDDGKTHITYFLRTSFILPVFMRDIETSDGYRVTYLVLFNIDVDVPYITALGNGGDSFLMLFDVLESSWRESAQSAVSLSGQNAEKVNGISLLDLYEGKGEELIRSEFFGPQMPDRNQKDQRQRKYPNLGVIVTKVSLVDWEDNASPALKEVLNLKSVLEGRRKRAIESKGMLAAEKDAAVVEGEKNKALSEAFKALSSDEVVQAVLALKEKGAKTEEVVKWLDAYGIARFQGSVFAPGGQIMTSVADGGHKKQEKGYRQ